MSRKNANGDASTHPMAPLRKALAAMSGNNRTWRAEAEKQRRWAWKNACLAANMMSVIGSVRGWRLGWTGRVLAAVWEAAGGFANLERQCFFGCLSELRLTAALIPTPPAGVTTCRLLHHHARPNMKPKGRPSFCVIPAP